MTWWACHVLVTLEADRKDGAVPEEAISASVRALTHPLSCRIVPMDRNDAISM